MSQTPTSTATLTPATPVLVTGAASGIGAACAEALAESGRAVVLWDVAADAVGALATRLAGQHGVRAVGTGVDVSRHDAFPAALDSARDAVGPIGGLVHCAGVVDSTPVTALGVVGWQRVIDVNLTAYAFLAASLADDLASLDGSAVVGIASINAIVGNGAIPSYAASKAGMLGLTRSLAAELGPAGVRVNSVCPGYITTPMTAQMMGDETRAANMAQLAMIRRVGRPEEIATVVRFLLSNEASFVTGSTIVADGGVVANDSMAAMS